MICLDLWTQLRGSPLDLERRGKKNNLICQEIYAARAQSSNSSAFEYLCYFLQVMLHPSNAELNPICHLLVL